MTKGEPRWSTGCLSGGREGPTDWYTGQLVTRVRGRVHTDITRMAAGGCLPPIVLYHRVAGDVVCIVARVYERLGARRCPTGRGRRVRASY